MATYTSTKYITRPNTSIEWPEVFLGLNGYESLKSSGKVSIDATYSADGLTQTTVYVWVSEEEYRNNHRNAPTRDPDLAATSVPYFDYMTENNLTGWIEEENGTIKVFNSTSKSFEVE
jgi:hypothetical protein